MKDFLKALIFAPFILPYKLLRGAGIIFTCVVLGHEKRGSPICQRCGSYC